MTTFSTIMNTQCLSKAAFNNVNSYVMTAYKIAAEKSMHNAANEAPCIDQLQIYRVRSVEWGNVVKSSEGYLCQQRYNYNGCQFCSNPL